MLCHISSADSSPTTKKPLIIIDNRKITCSILPSSSIGRVDIDFYEQHAVHKFNIKTNGNINRSQKEPNIVRFFSFLDRVRSFEFVNVDVDTYLMSEKSKPRYTTDLISMVNSTVLLRSGRYHMEPHYVKLKVDGSRFTFDSSNNVLGLKIESVKKETSVLDLTKWTAFTPELLWIPPDRPDGCVTHRDLVEKITIYRNMDWADNIQGGFLLWDIIGNLSIRDRFDLNEVERKHFLELKIPLADLHEGPKRGYVSISGSEPPIGQLSDSRGYPIPPMTSTDGVHFSGSQTSAPSTSEPSSSSSTTSEPPAKRQKKPIPGYALKQPHEDKYIICKICLEFAATIVFGPCGHSIMCPDCYYTLKKKDDGFTCSICRSPIESKIFTRPYSLQRERADLSKVEWFGDQ